MKCRLIVNTSWQPCRRTMIGLFQSLQWYKDTTKDAEDIQRLAELCTDFDFAIWWKPYVCIANHFGVVHECDRRTTRQNCDSNSDVIFIYTTHAENEIAVTTDVRKLVASLPSCHSLILLSACLPNRLTGYWPGKKSASRRGRTSDSIPMWLIYAVRTLYIYLQLAACIIGNSLLGYPCMDCYILHGSLVHDSSLPLQLEAAVSLVRKRHLLWYYVGLTLHCASVRPANSSNYV